MTEILTMIGIENATKVIAWVLAFISVSAITVSLVTEGLKSIKWINRIPTKLVCYVVAYMKVPVEWYMVFASFLASFVVAKVSMSGWDDVNELCKRLFRTK